MMGQFSVPLLASAICEHLRDRGFSVLLIHDDLSKHAVAYRQIALALRKPVGREAYPSDIFYLHARLLERACNMSTTYCSGSVACLPVVETLSNDMSAYIATNVVSITDGQLYFDAVMYGLGLFPSISIDKSVSRVGARSVDAF